MTNVGGNVDNLKRLEREQEQMALSAKLMHIRLSIDGSLKPFKSFPVVAEFNKQFDKIRGRYKFLVIEGKSMTGKTYYTKWLMGNPSRVFETNCASCPEPELRDFKALYHQVILFDEASPKMVLSQKKLFQAPPCFIELGCSTTNCHAYRALLSGIRLVICSNGWSEEVEALTSQADKDWLHDNSFLLNVKGDPMYT